MSSPDRPAVDSALTRGSHLERYSYSQHKKALLESLPRLGSDREQARSYSGFVETAN